MIETSDKIRYAIRSIWPNAVFLRLPDKRYYVPVKEEIDGAIDTLPILKVPKWADCNWFALQAYADIQLHKHSDEAPWSFGVADGNKFNKFPSQHTLNIAYTTTGIYLIDVQNNKRWFGSKTDDYVLTVSM